MKNVFKRVGASLTAHRVSLTSGIMIVAMAVGMLFTSCSGSKEDSLAAALPQDAIAVGRVDIKKLSEGDHLLADVIKMYVSEDMVKESGVDVKTPAYVFAHQNYGGCIFSLRDEDSFWKYTKADAEAQRGLKWANINGEFLIATDGKRAMLVGPANSSEQDKLRNNVSTWMKQTKCSVSKDLMKALDKGDGFFTMAASYDNLPSMLTREFVKQGIDLSGICVYADMSLTRKEAALVVGTVGSNKYLEKMLKLNASKRIDGSLAGAYGDRPFVQGEASCNGEKFLETLNTVYKQVPEFTQAWEMINSMVDVETVIKSLDGECGFVVPEFTRRGIPDVLVMANVKDEKFMKDVDKWNGVLSQFGGMQLSPFRGNVYELAGIGMPLYFGTQNKQMVLTTNKEMLDVKPKGKSALPKDVKGSYGYVCVDLAPTNLWERVWQEFPLLNLAPGKVKDIQDFTRLLIVAEDNTRVRFSLGTWE